MMTALIAISGPDARLWKKGWALAPEGGKDALWKSYGRVRTMRVGEGVMGFS
jgi:hypothetical protein